MKSLSNSQMVRVAAVYFGLALFNLGMAAAAAWFNHRGAAAGHLAFSLGCGALCRFYSRSAK